MTQNDLDVVRLNIARIMVEKGMTLNDLSIDSGAASKLLNGKRVMTVRTMQTFAQDLGISMQEITDDTEFKVKERVLDGKKSLYKLYEKGARSLIRSNSSDFTNSLEAGGLNSIVYNVLCGGNVREVTEFLTRNRLMISNAALMKLFIDMNLEEVTKDEDYLNFLGNVLSDANKNDERMLPLWLLGLTKKGLDNIVRGQDNLREYINKLSDTLEETTDLLEEQFGELSGEVELNGKQLSLDWNILSRLFIAIGAQTLTIRGSAKSMNGKLFEKLVLGAVLSLMGFKYIKRAPNSLKNTDKVFWLSSSMVGERETDATIVYNGRALAVDIGFIGKGNPEIMLDKVTRFRAQKKIGQLQHVLTTLVIIDTIPPKSQLPDRVEEVNGHIVEMNSFKWVKQLAYCISQELGCACYFENVNPKDLHEEIEVRLEEIDLESFIKKTADIMDDE